MPMRPRQIEPCHLVLHAPQPLISIFILLPLLIAGLSIMFLLAIPPGGYSL